MITSTAALLILVTILLRLSLAERRSVLVRILMGVLVLGIIVCLGFIGSETSRISHYQLETARQAQVERKILHVASGPGGWIRDVP